MGEARFEATGARAHLASGLAAEHGARESDARAVALTVT
jgi:hypothetical protein